MSTIESGYRGLALIVDINWDRLLFCGAIALALVAGSQMPGILH